MGLQVSRGDLEKASSTVRSGLDKIAQSATETQNQIKAFVEQSPDVLTGSGFNYVRSKLALYSNAMSRLSEISLMMANNMIESNNYMINETKGYDLNTDNLDELVERANQIRYLIRWYSEQIVVDDTVPEEERQYKMRNAEMKGYYEEILSKIDEKIELLRSLPAIAAAAAGLLDNITADGNTFASGVEAITISSIEV